MGGEKRYSFEAMDRLPDEVKKAKRIQVLRDKRGMRLEVERLKNAKSEDNINLRKHLKMIEDIVKLKAKNTLTDDSNLEEMSELERYKLFMNVSDSPRAALYKI